jgi:hypothetical protein
MEQFDQNVSLLRQTIHTGTRQLPNLPLGGGRTGGREDDKIDADNLLTSAMQRFMRNSGFRPLHRYSDEYAINSEVECGCHSD